MKIAWLSGGTFWGILLIVIGGLLVLRTAFNLQIPIVRTVIGVILIYLGISVLVGGSYDGLRGEERIAFEERTIVAVPAQRNYTILFSRGTIDFTPLAGQQEGHYEVDVVFSNGTLVLDKNTPTEVRVSAAFASTDLPTGQSVVLGDTSFTIGPDDAARRMVIKASVVFGSLRVILR